MNKVFVLLVLSIFFYGNTSLVIAQTKQKVEVTTTEAVPIVEESSKSPTEIKLNKLYISSRDKIEDFRKKQAYYFATVRDVLKVKLGIQVTGDILEKLGPTFSPPPAPTITNDPQKLGDLEIKKMDNPVDYGKLIFYTSMASLFSSALMFYGVLAFLVFFLIRVVFRMFI